MKRDSFSFAVFVLIGVAVDSKTLVAFGALLLITTTSSGTTTRTVFFYFLSKMSGTREMRLNRDSIDVIRHSIY